ncbi:MAG: hypothetical protein AAGC68_17145, partial [Verrucomicrobiota bacterium]
MTLRSLLSFLGIFSLVLSGAHAQHDAQRDSIMGVSRVDRAMFEKAFLNPRNDGGAEETWIVNLLMLLAEDEMKAAMSLAKEGLENGFNPDRLWMPGELLEKLRAQKGFSELPGIEAVESILHGPMIGNVTADSASVWVRTKGAQSLKLQIVIAWSADPVAVEEVVTTEENTIAKISFTELQPGTTYLGSQEGSESEEPLFQFTTRPAAGESSKFKVAFGGGAGYVPEYHRMWKTIADHSPDALLMLGDNVYIDDPEYVLTQQYCYHRRQSEPL